MSLHERFKEETMNNLKSHTVESPAELEAVLIEEITSDFHNGDPSKLAPLNRRYNKMCRDHTGENLSHFIAKMAEKGLVFMLRNSKRSSRIVPAEDWVEVYEEAMNQGDAAVEKLKQMYLEK
jgi:hypothetical protein